MSFEGGNANLYAYSSLDPVNYFDPNGLLVFATYNRRTGQLFVSDKETGRMAFIQASSGGKPWGDPIPEGTWEILERKGCDGFYRLDAVDLNMRDDIHGATGRDNFRLHLPGLTKGCIAADNLNDWGEVYSLIGSTTTDMVEENIKNIFGRKSGGMVRRYGFLRVVH